jgi:hypothetical protein
VTTVEEKHGTELEPVEVVDAELVDGDAPRVGDVAQALPWPQVPAPEAAVLAALDADAEAHLHRIQQGWAVWTSSTAGSPHAPACHCRSARSGSAPSYRS